MRASWSVVAAVVLRASAAWADPPAGERAMAEAEAAYEAQRYDEAIRLYRGLYEASRDVRALGRLAQAEQAAGQWQEAWRHYDQVLRTQGHDWVEVRRERITEQRRAVAVHLGRIVFPMTPTVALVHADGVLLGGDVRETYLTPGAHVVTFETYGQNQARRTITVREGETLEVDVDLQERSRASNARSADTHPEMSSLAHARFLELNYQQSLRSNPALSFQSATVLFVVGGALTLFGGVALGLAVYADHRFDADPQCGMIGHEVTGGARCESLDTQTYGWGGVAVLSLLGGAIGLVSAPLEVSRVREVRRQFRQRGYIVQLGPGPSSLGLGLTATF